MDNDLPKEDLLDAVHSFPCSFRIKVIGANDGHFVGRVLAAVRAELEEGIEPAFSTKTTSGGRHISVTVDQELESSSHVIAVYAQLREVEGLVMLM